MTRPNVRPIWSRACLDLLFELVKKKFGAYSEWAGECVPGDDDTVDGHRTNIEYAIFCRDFAKLVGAESVNAVGMKIVRFTLNKNLHGNASVAMATASALECGFLKTSEAWVGNPYSRPSWYSTEMDSLLVDAPQSEAA